MARNAQIPLLLQWTAANAIGVSLLGIVSNASLIVALIFLGILIALPQWFVLRARLKEAWQWIPVNWGHSFVSLALGLLGGEAVVIIATDTMGWFVEGQIQISDGQWRVPQWWLFPVATGFFYGAVLGVGQFAAMARWDQPDRSRRYWLLAWVIASAIGWSLSALIVAATIPVEGAAVHIGIQYFVAAGTV